MFVDKFLEIKGLVSPAEAGEDRLDVRHGHPPSSGPVLHYSGKEIVFDSKVYFLFKSPNNSSVKLTNKCCCAPVIGRGQIHEI